MRTRYLITAIAASLLLVPPLAAQSPTGTITGQVKADGSPLPGVTVVAKSPTLQGNRATVTSANGDFKLAFLPAGDYKLTYELEGFSTAVQDVVVSAAQSKHLELEMRLSEIVEEIVVSGALETISQTPSAETTYSIDEVEALPVARTIRSATLLMPGVSASGPQAGNTRNAPLSISGAMSFENLYLVNGVVVNENLRGQDLDLFIEDAIQEYTSVTAGASAEFGRFSGGVINVLTKSGGNDFSGSVRSSFTREDWTNETDQFAATENLSPVENRTDEATLGGPVWKDHIWFFAAYRDIGDQIDSEATVSPTNISYNEVQTQERFEGKVTISPTSSHSLVANYLEIDQTTTNSSFGNVLDLASLSDRNDPQELIAGHYAGILGSNFFVEAQYSERDFLLGDGSGSPFSDLIGGTLLRQSFADKRYHTGTFCGHCPGELRNNDNTLVKGSYFLSTDNAGSHDIVVGFDTFTDIRESNNFQSGSDFQVWGEQEPIFQGTDIFPVIGNGGGDWVVWFPVLESSLGTDFKTNSAYVNDTWQLNDKWSFNLGVRYDENDGQDAEGKQVTDDNRVSPRLGVSYDIKGDGDWTINASLGRYVAAIANSQADQTSAAGTPAVFVSFYGGPQINTGGGPLVNQDDALQTVFDWWLANGGLTDPTAGDLSALPGVFYSNIPGATSVIPTQLRSPFVDELTLGTTKRLGAKGLFRADLVFREFDDFYAQETSLRTGQTSIETGPGVFSDFDLTEVYNESDLLSREYVGLHTNFRYRATDRLTLAGNYTLSKLDGNFNGETVGAGPGNGAPLDYPEYKEARWNTPEGDLAADQRHKLRVWGIYDIFTKEHHRLQGSLLYNFASGTPYSATNTIDPSPFVTNPGYLTPSAGETYFFSERGAFSTDDLNRFDLSLNYSFVWNVWNRSFEVFLQPELLNVFDDQATLNPDNTVNLLDPFDPFTETPVEGVHWEKGPDFGQALNPNGISLPQTFRFSVGFRF